MDLATVFRICLYGMAAYAAWILGRAEEGWIPYVTFPVLATAYVVIEAHPGRSLPPTIANIIGMLAVAAAGWEFSLPREDAKLLSGAHLLVYATWIVMLQEKTYRLYWWVMALGVLQVAVASVLESGPWFGFCLVIYICGALLTMSIASLYQVQQQFGADEAKWKYETMPAYSSPVSSIVRSGVQHDETQSWLTRRFFGGVTVLTMLSLVVSSAFFALTPRVWFGPQNIFGDDGLSAQARRAPVTGFAREVKLGDMGEILESVVPVFSIVCRDSRTKEVIDLPLLASRLGMEEPLFRGAVMTEYRNGRWIPEQDSTVKATRFFNRAGYTQQISMEPTTDPILFCVGTPAAVEINGRSEDVYVQLSTGIISREQRPESKQRLSYTVHVGPLPADLLAIRGVPMPAGQLHEEIQEPYLVRNTLINRRSLPRLTAFARERYTRFFQQLGRKPTTLEFGRHLESYFKDSGEYGYSLNQTIRDPNVDPLEDFLFNRKEGHCEYYASALTLMLRAVGVPARLVSGFKGAEYNSLRGVWEVQERFGHAWVEVWSEENVWATLDPTPSVGRAESVEEVSTKIGLWARMRASSASFWQDYVVNVNLRQQQDSLYSPIKSFFAKFAAAFRKLAATWEALWEQTLDFLTHPSKWFSVTGGVVSFAILLFLGLLTWGAGRLRHWLRSGGWERLIYGNASQTRIVVFYERFARALQHAGVRREPSQTPQEFAVTATERLRKVAYADFIDDFPGQISNAFYRVRFGGESLSDDETATIESRLQSLESALAARPH